MITGCKIKKGKTYLDHHLCANDYYSEGEEVVGTWVGKAAQIFGISGNEIHAKDSSFKNIRMGLTPDGKEKLTYKPRKDGLKFIDFQISAQKSVSILGVLYDERLKLAHQEAAQLAFEELERFAAKRAYIDYQPKLTGTLCAAKFHHDTSRSLDPQLHTHFVVANVTIDQKGKRFALTEFEIFRAIRYAGKVYQNELAKRCVQLGYQIHEKRNTKGIVEGFEITGVTEEVMQLFSKRREEIEKRIKEFKAERGRSPSSAEIAVITRQTRESKLTEIATPKVRAKQRAQLQPNQEKQLIAIVKSAFLSNTKLPSYQKDARQAITYAGQHLTERQSVVKGHDLLATALNQGLGRLDLQLLKDHLTLQSGNLLQLDSQPIEHAKFTHLEHARREVEALNFVQFTKGTAQPMILNYNPIPGLGKDQNETLKHILESKDIVTGVRGVAGSGKTTILKELDTILSANGYRMIYLAPTRSAVNTLKKQGFENATTISSYLVDARHKNFKNRIVICDEAGLQSMRQGYELLCCAQKHKQRLAFIGDEKQHVSVEAGDFFRLLKKRSAIEIAELSTIRRQKDPQYLEIASLLSKHQTADALKQAHDQGFLVSDKDYLKIAADHHLEHIKQGRDAVLVAPTWAENDILTSHVRDGLRQANILGEERSLPILKDLNKTQAQLEDTRNYSVGQLIVFNRGISRFAKKNEQRIVAQIQDSKIILDNGKQLDVQLHKKDFSLYEAQTQNFAIGDKVLCLTNDNQKDLTNGEVLTVTGFSQKGLICGEKELVVGEHVFRHGHCITSHKSQGVTHDYVTVAASQFTKRGAYVSMTRGREGLFVVTADYHHLIDSVNRSDTRELASEATEELSKIVAQYELSCTKDSNGKVKIAQVYAESSIQSKEHAVEIS